MTNRLSKVSSAATLSTPSEEILVPFVTLPEPSLVELTAQCIPMPPDALNRRVPPANTDVRPFSALIDNVENDLKNVTHPVETRDIITKRENNTEYFFIFFIFL